MGGSHVVITGVDKDNVRKTLGARTKFVRALIEDGTLSRSGSLIFRDVQLTPVAEEMEELMGVKYYTQAEMLEVAAKVTPPAAKAAPEFTLYATKFSHDAGSAQVEFDDLEAFADEDPIIVLSSRHGMIAGLHAYLENREIIESDTPIYVLDELQLRVFNAVKDTATFYIHSTEMPTVRSVAASEGIKNAVKIAPEERSVHLKSKSDDELITIAFSRYARYRYYGASDNGTPMAAVLTAVLQRDFAVKEDAWYEARREPADAAMNVLRGRLAPEVLTRIDGAVGSMGTLVRAAEANVGESIEALVDAVIALPNGLG